MRYDELRLQRVQRIEPEAPIAEPAERRLVLWGIHGGHAFVTGIQIGDTFLARAPHEEAFALRVRAMREVVPSLPVGALRDSKGAAVGYFVYSGLPPDYCQATAEREGQL